MRIKFMCLYLCYKYEATPESRVINTNPILKNYCQSKSFKTMSTVRPQYAAPVFGLLRCSSLSKERYAKTKIPFNWPSGSLNVNHLL